MLRIGQEIYPLARRSKRSGIFQDELVLPADRFSFGVSELEVAPQSSEQRPRWNPLARCVPMSLVSPQGDDIGAASHVHFVPNRGLSVISDIDDTLKETHVHERRAMLMNTFLRDFVPVPGMKELYCRWHQAGAMFHYVSSSPWQLYEPLAKYFRREDLPTGSFHLRAFRLRDHMLRRIFLGRRPVKGLVIRNLMLRFPARRFALLGDSGEYDPEIYGALAPLSTANCRHLYSPRTKSTHCSFPLGAGVPQITSFVMACIRRAE